MRSTVLSVLASVALLGTLSACDSFIDNTAPLVDRVDGDSLNQQSQVPFLSTGVKLSFNSAYDQLALAADLLSDAFLYNTRVRNATFPTYSQIDRADIPLESNTVRNAYNAAHAYRFAADDLVDRALNRITFTDDDAGTAARTLALYTGYLHGGLSRHFLASYFGPEPTVGGSPISASEENPEPVIPSAELYAQALEKYRAGLPFASGYNLRLLNTLIARAHLYRGEFEQAAAAAAEGLVPGDAPFQGRYESRSPNEWWESGGRGRTQIHAATRFVGYATGIVGTDTTEADRRIAVEVAPNAAGVPASFVFFRQALYPLIDSPIDHATWQEASLIRAEAAIRAGSPGTALPLLNAVRTAAGLADLSEATLEALVEERDRQFFTQGVRLIDQRRFGLFHTTTTQASGEVALGPWRYLPIPSDERDNNPNVP